MIYLAWNVEVLNSAKLVSMIIILLSIFNISYIYWDLKEQLKFIFSFSYFKNLTMLYQIVRIWIIWLVELTIILKKNENTYKKLILKSKLIDLRKRPINFLVQMKITSRLKIRLNSQNTFRKICNTLNQPFNKNLINLKLIKKEVIRKSIFFSKTKYSFIRQECKNIVNMTLLVNVIFVIIVFCVYLKFKFTFSLANLIVLVFVIINISSMFRFKNQLKSFFLILKNLIQK